MASKKPEIPANYDDLPTREKLLLRIERHLAANPHLTPEGFGWAAIKDSYLVTRLRKGGDITTGKLDAVIKYLSNPT